MKKYTFGQRLLSYLLALVMVAGMIPAMTITADAASFAGWAAKDVEVDNQGRVTKITLIITSASGAPTGAAMYVAAFEAGTYTFRTPRHVAEEGATQSGITYAAYGLEASAGIPALLQAAGGILGVPVIGESNFLREWQLDAYDFVFTHNTLAEAGLQQGEMTFDFSASPLDILNKDYDIALFINNTGTANPRAGTENHWKSAEIKAALIFTPMYVKDGGTGIGDTEANARGSLPQAMVWVADGGTIIAGSNMNLGADVALLNGKAVTLDGGQRRNFYGGSVVVSNSGHLTLSNIALSSSVNVDNTSTLTVMPTCAVTFPITLSAGGTVNGGTGGSAWTATAGGNGASFDSAVGGSASATLIAGQTLEINGATYAGPMILTVNADGSVTVSNTGGGTVTTAGGDVITAPSGGTLAMSASGEMTRLTVPAGGGASVAVSGGKTLDITGNLTLDANGTGGYVGSMTGTGNSLSDGATTITESTMRDILIDSTGAITAAGSATDFIATGTVNGASLPTGGTVTVNPDATYTVTLRNGADYGMAGSNSLTDTQSKTANAPAVVTMDASGVITKVIVETAKTADYKGLDYTGPVTVTEVDADTRTVAITGADGTVTIADTGGAKSVTYTGTGVLTVTQTGDGTPDDPITAAMTGGSVTDSGGISVTGTGSVAVTDYAIGTITTTEAGGGSMQITPATGADPVTVTGDTTATPDGSGGLDVDLGISGEVTDNTGTTVEGPGGTVKVDDQGSITRVDVPTGEASVVNGAEVDNGGGTGSVTVTIDPVTGDSTIATLPGGTTVTGTDDTQITGPASNVVIDDAGNITSFELPATGEATIGTAPGGAVTGPATVTDQPDGKVKVDLTAPGTVTDKDGDPKVTGPATVTVDPDTGDITGITLPESGQVDIGGETFVGPADVEVTPDGKVKLVYHIPDGDQETINGVTYHGPATVTVPPDAPVTAELEGTNARIVEQDGSTFSGIGTFTVTNANPGAVSQIVLETGENAAFAGAAYTGPGTLTVAADNTITANLAGGGSVTDANGDIYRGGTEVTVENTGALRFPLTLNQGDQATIDGITYTGNAVLQNNAGVITAALNGGTVNGGANNNNLTVSGNATVGADANGSMTAVAVAQGKSAAIGGTQYTGQANLTVTGGSITQTRLGAGGSVSLGGAAFTGPDTTITPSGGGYTAVLAGGGTIDDANSNPGLVGPAGSVTISNTGHISRVEVAAGNNTKINNAIYTGAISVAVQDDGTATSAVEAGERITGANGYVMEDAANVVVNPYGNIISATLGLNGRATINLKEYTGPGTFEFDATEPPAPGTGGELTGRFYEVPTGTDRSDIITGVTYGGYAEVTVSETSSAVEVVLGKVVKGTGGESPTSGSVVANGVTYSGKVNVLSMNSSGVVSGLTLVAGDNATIANAVYNGAGSLAVSNNGHTVAATMTSGTITDVNGWAYTGTSRVTLTDGAFVLPLALASGETVAIDGVTYTGPASVTKDASDTITATLSAGSVTGATPEVSGTATVTVDSGGSITGITVNAPNSATIGGTIYTGQATVTVAGGSITRTELGAGGRVTLGGITYTGPGAALTYTGGAVSSVALTGGSAAGNNVNLSGNATATVTGNRIASVEVTQAGGTANINGAVYTGTITVTVQADGTATADIQTGEQIRGANGYVVNNAANVKVNKHGNIISADLGQGGTAVINNQTYNGPGEFTFDDTAPPIPGTGGELTGRTYIIENSQTRDDIIPHVHFEGYAEITADDDATPVTYGVVLGKIVQGQVGGAPNPGTVREQNGAAYQGVAQLQMNAAGNVTSIILDAHEELSITMGGETATYNGPATLTVNSAAGTVTAAITPASGGTIVDKDGIRYTGTASVVLTNSALPGTIILGPGEQVVIDGTTYTGPGTVKKDTPNTGEITAELDNPGGVSGNGNPPVTGNVKVTVDDVGKITEIVVPDGKTAVIDGLTYEGLATVTVEPITGEVIKVVLGDNGKLTDNSGDVVEGPAQRITMDAGNEFNEVTVTRGQNTKINGATYAGEFTVTMIPEGEATANIGATGDSITGANGYVVNDAANVKVNKHGNIISADLGQGGLARIEGKDYTGPGSFTFADDVPTTSPNPPTPGDGGELTSRFYEVPTGTNRSDIVTGVTYGGYAEVTVNETSSPSAVRVVLGKQDQGSGTGVSDTGSVTVGGVIYSGKVDALTMDSNGVVSALTLVTGDNATIANAGYNGAGSLTVAGNTVTASFGTSGTITDANGKQYSGGGPVTVQNGVIQLPLTLDAGDNLTVNGVSYTGPASLNGTWDNLTVTLTGGFTAGAAPDVEGDATITVTNGAVTRIDVASANSAEIDGDAYTGKAQVTVAGGKITNVNLSETGSKATVAGVTYTGKAQVTVDDGGASTAVIADGATATDASSNPVVTAPTTGALTVRAKNDGNINQVDVAAASTANINGATYTSVDGITVNLNDAGYADAALGTTGEKVEGSNAYVVDNATHVEVDPNGLITFFSLGTGGTGTIRPSTVIDGPGDFTVNPDGTFTRSTIVHTGDYNNTAITGIRVDGYARIDGPTSSVYDVVLGTADPTETSDGWITDQHGNKFTGPGHAKVSDSGEVTQITLTNGQTIEITMGGKTATYTGAGVLTINSANGAVTADMNPADGGKIVDAEGVEYAGDTPVVLTNSVLPDALTLLSGETLTTGGATYTGAGTVTKNTPNAGDLSVNLTEPTSKVDGTNVPEVTGPVQVTGTTGGQITQIVVPDGQDAVIDQLDYHGEAIVAVNPATGGVTGVELKAGGKLEDRSGDVVEGPVQRITMDADREFDVITVIAGDSTTINGAVYAGNFTVDMTPEGQATADITATGDSITGVNGYVVNDAANVVVNRYGNIISADLGADGTAVINQKTYNGPGSFTFADDTPTVQPNPPTTPGDGGALTGRVYVIGSGDRRSDIITDSMGYYDSVDFYGYAEITVSDTNSQVQVVLGKQTIQGSGVAFANTGSVTTGGVTYSGRVKYLNLDTSGVTSLTLEAGDEVNIAGANYNGIGALAVAGNTITATLTSGTITDVNGWTYTGTSAVTLTNGAFALPLHLAANETVAIGGVTYQGRATINGTPASFTAALSGGSATGGGVDVSGQATVTVANGGITQIEVADNTHAAIGASTYTGQATVTVANGTITMVALGSANSEAVVAGVAYTGQATVRVDAGGASTADLQSGATATDASGNPVVRGSATVTVGGDGNISSVRVTNSGGTVTINGAEYTGEITVTLDTVGNAWSDLDTGETIRDSKGYVANTATNVRVDPDGRIVSFTLGDDGEAEFENGRKEDPGDYVVDANGNVHSTIIIPSGTSRNFYGNTVNVQGYAAMTGHSDGTYTAVLGGGAPGDDNGALTDAGGGHYTGPATLTLDANGNVTQIVLASGESTTITMGGAAATYTGPGTLTVNTGAGTVEAVMGAGGRLVDKDGIEYTGTAPITLTNSALPNPFNLARGQTIVINGATYEGPGLVTKEPDGSVSATLNDGGKVTDVDGNTVTAPTPGTVSVEVDPNGRLVHADLRTGGTAEIDGTSYTSPADIKKDPGGNGYVSDLEPGGTVEDPDGDQVTGPARVTTDENGEIIDVVLPDTGEAEIDNTKYTGPATIDEDPNGGHTAVIEDGGTVQEQDGNPSVTGPARVEVDSQGNITRIELPDNGQANIGGTTYPGPAILDVNPDGTVSVVYIIPSGETRNIGGANYTGYAEVAVATDGSAKATFGPDGSVRDVNGDTYTGPSMDLDPSGAFKFPITLALGETAVIDGATYTGPAVLNKEANDSITATLTGGKIVDRNGSTYTGATPVNVVNGELPSTLKLLPGETVVIHGATYYGPAELTVDNANRKVEAKLASGGKIVDKNGGTYDSTTAVTVTNGELPAPTPVTPPPVIPSKPDMTPIPESDLAVRPGLIGGSGGSGGGSGSADPGDTIPGTTPNEPYFYDVPDSDPFAGPVNRMAAMGLMNGVRERIFEGNGSTTRAMIWTILGRGAGQGLYGDGVYDRARSWAMGAAVSDGSNPNAFITRQQFAVMLWRMSGEPESTWDLSGFRDSGDIADYALTAIRWAVEKGILEGTADNKLMPGGNATRYHVAAMYVRFLG